MLNSSTSISWIKSFLAPSKCWEYSNITLQIRVKQGMQLANWRGVRRHNVSVKQMCFMSTLTSNSAFCISDISGGQKLYVSCVCMYSINRQDLMQGYKLTHISFKISMVGVSMIPHRKVHEANKETSHSTAAYTAKP